MLLSICIPTYNRASPLEALLDTMITQADESNAKKIELIICDNHSTDHTEALVENVKRKSPFAIKYVRHPRNLGLIRNLFSTVEYASGQYCWLMGSDDNFEPGALNRIIHYIETYPDVSVFVPQFRIYDSTLTNEVGFASRPIHKFPNQFKAEPFEVYAKDIVYEFGFLSVLVFKRTDWNAVEPVEEFKENFYYHVYIIVMIALHNPLMLVQEKLIAYRSDNDSVLTAIGVYKRVRIMIEEYQVLLVKAFGRKAYEENMQQMLRFHFAGSLYSIQMTFSFREKYSMFKLLYKYYKYSGYFWFSIFPRIFIPKAMIRLIWKRKKGGNN